MKNKKMNISQDMINDLLVNLVKITEGIEKEIRVAVGNAEDSGDPKKFKNAQETKISLNELSAHTGKVRSDYPHLFKN